MTDYPEKGDVLVRPALPGEDWDMNTCFMQGTWDLYAEGYREAANRIYEWVASNHSRQDTLVYPFVFNWRQHVELRLKETIVRGRFLPDQPPRTKWGHSLQRLWEEVRTLLETIAPDESAEHDSVASVIGQLESLDPNSQRTRYPLHRNGHESFPPGTPNLSLENFHVVMVKLAAYFDGATGYLAGLEDGKADEIAADRWER